MYKQIGKRITVISILFIMFFSFLINKGVLGVTDDDGPDVSDSSIDWKLTCFDDGTLGTGFTSSSFATNDKYGWCEYEKDGTSYVVLAGATHELNQSSPKSFPRLSYIHYFNYYDTIQFKFVDESFDNNTYNGIILDSCGASMNPPNYGHASNVQILDVFFSKGSYNEKISGQHVLVTMDGTFAKTAGKSSKQNIGDILYKGIYEFLSACGDWLQKTTNANVGFSKNKSEKLTYTRGDIEASEKMNKQIQVTDAPKITNEEEQENKDTETYKTLVTKNIKPTAYNNKGVEQTIYTTSTEIPVIPTDYYSSTTRQVDSIDADFFDNTGKNDNKRWNEVWKNLFRNASRVSMYIASGFLFVMIIWRSVMLVLSTMRHRPKGAFEAKKSIDQFFGAVLMIAGIYLVMVLIMFLYRQVLNVFLNGNSSRYLIRVNVEGVYSFNTNLIGYTKFLAIGADESIRNAGAYFLTAFINFVCIGAMTLRMLFIGISMVLAPFTAVNYMRDTGKTKNKSFLNFSVFIRRYIIVVFLPLVLAGIYKFILLVA